MESRAETTDEEVTESGTRKPRAGAVKLTDRDKDMLGLLALARYMTVQQVHRLCFAGRHLSLAYRRLLKLTRGDGGPPFVRQRFFRTYDGNRVAVWAPTPHGLAAASVRTGGLPELPRYDVGAHFLEHLIQLNELFVALWRTADGRSARVAHPSFHWVPSDAVRLTYAEYEPSVEYRRQGEGFAPRVIQPDAMLELPAQRRRYFLECEMGGHTIAPRTRKPPGATLSKTERYNEYLTGVTLRRTDQTHYAAQYPDAFAAEVLFLVRSAGRASAINGALASWRNSCGLATRFATIRAVTFQEATAELRRLAGLPPLDPRPPANTRAPGAPPSPPALTREEADLLNRYLFESTNAIHRARATFRLLGRTELPEYPPCLEDFSALVGRLSGAAQRGSGEAKLR